MIRRVLVADRGQVARRVFTTCRMIGIEPVAVYSDADPDAPYVAEADWAVHLPGTAPTATYLRGDLLLAAARKAGADALHPGAGPLAGDPEFAAAVIDAGLTWVGPPAKTLATLADPAELVAQLAGAGLPVLPDPDTAVGPVRHLEIQVVSDPGGNTITFGERETSLGQGERSLVVECPSPVVPPDLREELVALAVQTTAALGYVGAGTVELVLAADGTCHVRGLSPRLGAEHAVSECAAGLDLVRLQLLVAEGAPLPFTGAPPIRGHTVGVRLRAEDPATAWLPTTGVLHRFTVGPVSGQFRPLASPGLRLDAGVSDGAVISTRHDPAMATVVAWAPTRYEAARLLAGALARARIHGVVTNRDLVVRVLRHPAFLAGAVDTTFLDRHPEVFAPLLSSVDAVRLSCLAAALAAAADRRAGASLPSGWRNVPVGAQTAVFAGPAGTVEIGYWLDRSGELASWWVRAVDPDELDLTGLGQPSSLPDDHPPVAISSATPEQVVLDVAGVRLTFAVHRVANVSYVDSAEGPVVLTELPRYPIPDPLPEDPADPHTPPPPALPAKYATNT